MAFLNLNLCFKIHLYGHLLTIRPTPFLPCCSYYTKLRHLCKTKQTPPMRWTMILFVMIYSFVGIEESSSYILWNNLSSLFKCLLHIWISFNSNTYIYTHEKIEFLNLLAELQPNFDEEWL